MSNLVRAVALISKTSSEVMQLMAAQQYDLGLADVAMLSSAPSPLTTHETFEFNCVCAMRHDDPLAIKRVITAADLDGKPMGVLFAEHTTFRQTKAAFEIAKARFNQRFEMQYFVPMFSLVERKLAYAIVDPLSAESYLLGRLGGQQLVFRPFKPAVTFSCAILTPLHRPRSVASAAFQDVLRTELRRIQSNYGPQPEKRSGARRN